MADCEQNFSLNLNGFLQKPSSLPIMMADPNLQEIHDFLIDLARKAGEMITSANPSRVDTKKNCMLV